MNIIERLRAHFDAPQFCQVDGKPISVTENQVFDSHTGRRRSIWTWHCPDVDLETDGNGHIRHAEQRATTFVHRYGTGRPRWHQLTNSEGLPNGD